MSAWEPGFVPSLRAAPQENPGLLGCAAASARDRRIALLVSGLLVAAFLLTVPFAAVQLPALPGFVPAYDAAVVILDFITAMLLYTQYRELKLRSLLALTCGYAFTPPLVAAHALGFPDAFGPGYLIGGEQTAAWLWMGWHGLFPLFVSAYALLAWRERRRQGPHVVPAGRFGAASALVATLALSATLIALTTAGESYLPDLMMGNRYQSLATKWIFAMGWGAHLLALGLVTGLTRLRRVIDLWLSVVLLAALIDLALSAMLVDARFLLGFYAGRFYGLLAASFMLVLLLRETFRLQIDAVRAWDALQASEEQFRRAIEDAPIPVIMLAEDGQVLQLSKAWTQTTGYALADIPTLDAWLCRSGTGADDGIGEQMRRLFDGKAPRLGIEFGVLTRYGAARRWSCSFSEPGTLRDGRRFIVGMALDITERKQGEERLERERLAALNLMEDAILAQQQAERATAALRESEARFRALADASPVLVWQLDAQGGAIYFNQRCLNMTGLPLEQLLGDGWRAIVHPDDLPAYADLLAGAVRERTLVQARVRARTGGGQWHWFDCHAAPWFAAAGQYRGHVGIAIDVTHAVQAEQALKESSRRKDEFLAMLAHELRNPLAPISNALCLLKYTDSGGRRTADRLIRMMDRQFGNMVRLVDDLLEIARITSGKIELARSRVDLVEIVRGAVETSAPLIQKGKHQLALDLPGHPLWIHADAVRMNQVIANLLNNAAKYTGEGGHIALHARAEGQQAVVSVRDDGAGIPPGMLEDVFEMFRQVPGKAHNGQDGLGIGLSIVRRLMQLHGGTAQARSEGLGKGSEFIVRMPLLESPPAASAGSRPPYARHGAPLSGCSVLVVDDNRDAADTLAVLLQSEGAEVHVAHDGSAALAELDNYHPQTVVLDIGLPDISGYEVAQRIRSRHDFDDVRLIALTGWGQDEDRSKSRESGFNEHLTKPVDFGVLESLLMAR